MELRTKSRVFGRKGRQYSWQFMLYVQTSADGLICF